MTFSLRMKFLVTFAVVFGFLIDLSSSACDEIAVAESRILQTDEDEFSNCGEDHFECRDRECIPIKFLCDGRADCLDQSDETQSECKRPHIKCPDRSFRCDYGACVAEDAICDGFRDCLDNSDELLPECPRASPRVRFPLYLAIYDEESRGRLSTDRRVALPRRRIHRVKVPRQPVSLTSLPGQLRPSRPLQQLPPLTPLTALRSGFSPESSEVSRPLLSCIVPPQPVNGYWKLHRRFCSGNSDCDIPQGIALQLGSQLVYSCARDFMVRGSRNVYCEDGEKWSSIPICVAVTCDPLNSVSRAATCTRFGDRVSCRSSILPYTRAKVTCRKNYGLEGTFTTGYEQSVECLPDGRWAPEPITCSPVCGVVNTLGPSGVAINGISAEARPFPWHANVWREIETPRGPELQFRCSATIIETNFVVTAAHCVIDERTGTSVNPRWLRVTGPRDVADEFIAAGNPSWIVHKVKNIYRYCEFYGLLHGYASDIAILELIDPFEFTPAILPACLDVSSLSQLTFTPGTVGRIDGFGRRSSSTPSPILQSVEVTYVPNSECKVPYNPSQTSTTINNDEFCGVYSNDTAVCDWDNGGGFVVKKSGLWHLMGVFIMDLGLRADGTQRACGENPYSLYTKVPPYMAWIQDVMFQLNRYKTYPLCSFDLAPPLQTTTATTPWTSTTWYTTPSSITPAEPPSTTASVSTTTAPSIPTTTPISIETRTTSSVGVFCSPPQQPANGEWKLNQDPCDTTNCDIPENVVLLSPGSQLLYTCDPGFRIKGNPEVFCSTRGRWSAIPECVEIRCDSLESKSRMVTCYRFNNWAPCNSSALPNTRAVISCRVGYREDTSSLQSTDKTVDCNENGMWEPNPIKCVPVCGLTNVRQAPTVINGTAARITEFPWHASLYMQMNATQGSKQFICGATIIQENLLLTAAHCVYDDRLKVVETPEKFSIAAGNQFQDYDSPLHDPRVVQKSTVKNVYVPCDYFGLQGNYASDIALIELREPLQLSSVLTPACLDATGNTDQVLESGSVGRFAGFGRTATAASSANLLATRIPYVGFSECKMSQSDGSNVALIVRDKFCGGSSLGMSVCNGDSGGGLTFDTGGVSTLLGILSVNLGVDTSTGEATCDGTAYSLYTKVSDHMPWIRNVMNTVESNKTYPSCGSQ